jgi:hypothetical protein
MPHLNFSAAAAVCLHAATEPLYRTKTRLLLATDLADAITREQVTGPLVESRRQVQDSEIDVRYSKEDLVPGNT